MPRFLSRGLLAALAASLLVGAGCLNLGKKEWPKPVKSEDRFSFDRIKATRQAECLVIEVLLGGAAANLSSATVLLEPVGAGADDGCAACPFTARRHVPLGPGILGFERMGPSLRLSFCGLAPGKAFRWMLVGRNAFPVLGQVESDVFTAEP